MTNTRETGRTGEKLTSILTGLLLLQAHTLSHADYTVQVGAFSDKARADRFVAQLENQRFPASTYNNKSGTTTLNRVRIGPYPDKPSAENVRLQLESEGISGFLVENSPSSAIRNSVRETAQASPATTSETGSAMLVAESAAGQEEVEPAGIDDLFMPVPDEAGASATGQDQAADPAGIDDLFMPVPGETGTADGAPGEIENVPGEGWVTKYNTAKSKYNIRGFLNSKYAYTYSSPGHSSMFRNTLELESSGRINSGISWNLSARGVYDPVFEMNDFYPDRVRDNRRLEGALHETYLDVSAGDWDFRLGRQNIIWGEMVGLFFADVVSAKDTRQFVAEDFDLIRIPQWALRAEHFKGDFHSEAIWIPYMTYNEIGEPGDDFYPLGTKPLPGNTVIANDDQPAQKLSNGAYGLRLSMLKAGWDISGFFYHSMDATPFFTTTINNGKTIITPEHDKVDQLGFTLAKDFGLLLFKSEAIYTKDRWVNVEDTNNLTGVVQQDIFDYVIGLEYTTPDNTLLNFQFYQRWYTDYDSDILFDEFESGVGLFTKIELGNKVEAELLLLTQLNRTDWMARPKVSWSIGKNWLLQVGADIFGGDDTIGLFGRFNDSDRVYGNARYVF